jgi:hypothetical protein
MPDLIECPNCSGAVPINAVARFAVGDERSASELPPESTTESVACPHCEAVLEQGPDGLWSLAGAG